MQQKTKLIFSKIRSVFRGRLHEEVGFAKNLADLEKKMAPEMKNRVPRLGKLIKNSSMQEVIDQIDAIIPYQPPVEP